MKRFAQLDAVRGIAILLVLIHNTDSFSSLHLGGLPTYGWMGVDLFFVLSGFLITGILLDSKQSQGYFKNFYARRCLRIWPLYYTVIILMFAIVPHLQHADAYPIFGRSSPWWAYPFFLQDFLVKIPSEAAGPLGVTWSLAIEEQFYLAWPLFVRFGSTARIKRIAVAVVLASPLVRYYLGLHHVDIYSNLFCRLDGLMAGAALAAWVRSETFAPAKFLKLAGTSFVATAFLAVLTAHYQVGWITFSMTSLASASLLYLSLFSRQKWLQSIFANRFLAYSGRISYGLYLLHKLPLDIMKTTHTDWPPFLILTLTIAVSYALAAASWAILEKPFLKLKRFFESQRVAPAWSPAAPTRVSPRLEQSA